jgi:F-type H+-transporting ATPase subunit epsilon
MPLKVELVSPERLLYEGEASQVDARTADGEIGFLPGHIPFVGTLQPWVVRIQCTDGSVQRIAVHGGFVELSHDHVTLLSDIAELAEDIDVDRAQRALARAEEALRATPDDADAIAARERAVARLRAAGAIS